MKKDFGFFSLIFLSVLNTHAQLTPTVTPTIDQFGIIKSLGEKRGPGTKGSIYLNDQWLSSNIYFKQELFAGGKIEAVPIKLDLATNTIEINTKDGIKVLRHTKVEKFEWINPENSTPEVYTNCDKFILNGSTLESFCMIYGNTTKLVKHNYLDVLKADYNVALNVGSKDDRIVKKSKLYITKGNELIQCNKKSVYSVMADKADMVKQFVKKNRLDLDEENDLRSVIDYYNSI